MPRLDVEGAGTFEVERDKRSVLAIEEDAGVDIMHACVLLDREVHHMPGRGPRGRARSDYPGGVDGTPDA